MRRDGLNHLFFGCFSLLYLVASLRLETVDIKGFSKTLSVNFRRLLRPNVATFLLYVATLVATFLWGKISSIYRKTGDVTPRLLFRYPAPSSVPPH